jgi:hypothetical protein
MAFVGPALAAVATWFLTSASTSSSACFTGEGSGSILAMLAVAAALVLVTPIAIGCYGWRRDPYSPRVALAIVTSIVLAVPLIFLATQIWWFAHNCMI